MKPDFNSTAGLVRETSNDHLQGKEEVQSTIATSGAWKELESAMKQDVVPQSVVLFAPVFLHEPFLLLYAHALFSREPETGIPVNGWNGDSHPDLVILGAPGTPPGIEECRNLQSELSSRPVCSDYRLAVIHCAHRLSLPAANSLLKITEEPPPRGRILLLLEEDLLLPTLRSRSWCLRLALEQFLDPLQPPQEDSDWIAWLREVASGKTEGILLHASRWARWYALHGHFQKAADLDGIVILAQKTRLSASMAADLIFLMMREEVSLEHIFDSLR